MSDASTTKPTTAFWVIGGLALVWNILGALAYLGDVMMSPEARAALEPNMQEIYANRPTWVVAAFAIAVWAGVLGCVGLLLRKAWATPVLIGSLVCVVAQQFYGYFLSNTASLMGTTGIIMSNVILIIAIALVWYSRKVQSRGWIS
jgi:hypothetical protein